MLRSVTGVVIAASLLVPATASAAKPRLKAFAAYDSGACGERGLNVFVSAKLPKGTTTAEAREIRTQYAPRGKGALELGGDTYTLSPKRSRDFGDTEGATWFFGVVRVDEETGEGLIGQRGELSYKTKARALRFTVKVGRAGCG